MPQPSPSRRRRLLLVVAATTLLATGCGQAPAAPPVAEVAAPVVASPAPTAAPSTPTPTAMAASAPVRLTIPAIGVDTELMSLGLNPDGTLEVPPAGFPAGWYTGAPTPGEPGPAVIAGHVDWTDGPGVFYDLADLRPADEIAVVRTDGIVVSFVVVGVAAYAKDQFPTEQVYGDTVGPELRLITCGGSFDRSTGHYVDNLVVYATMTGSTAAPSVPASP